MTSKRHFRVVLFFDGGIREGLMAYGYAAFNPDDSSDELFSGNKTCGKGTSNIAEYRALIAGLHGCLEQGVIEIHIYGDSQLIIKQITGVFKVKKDVLIEHRDCVLKLLERFNDWTIKWIPREDNIRADSLVNDVFKKKAKECGKKQKK